MAGYTTAFCDLEWADRYFQERTNSGNWIDASTEEKNAALATATRDITRYSTFTETVYVNGKPQTQSFVYAYDGSETRVIPDKLKEACCEQAIYKLSVDRLDAIETTRAGIASAKGVVFDTNAIPDQLSDECIDLLMLMGASVDAAAGGNSMNWMRTERIER